MKIHCRNASAQLFEKAHALAPKHNSWRCIMLTFSGAREHYSQTLRTYFIVKGLIEALGDEDGHIYLCSDGDICILFQGALRPVLSRLAHYFGDIDLSRATQARRDQFLTVFDLSTDWDDFMNFCFAKSLAAETFDDEHYYMLHEVMPLLAASAAQEG